MINPRDYQEWALTAWLDWVSAGKGNPLLLYPTGVGKSVIIALIIEHCIKHYPGTRTMVLTHSKELIQQDYDKLKQYWPEAPAGIYCEGLKRREYWNSITIGSIQTVYNMPELFGHIDLLFIDEAHLISLKDDSMYRSFIAKLRVINPNLVTTGLTATGWRAKQGYLWMGENALFDGAAVDACSVDAFNWFLDQGYLVPPIAKKTKFQYNTSEVKVHGGEYSQKDAEEKTNKKDLNERVVITMLEAFKDAGRNSGLVFCNGIKHVEKIAEVFEYYGANVTYVHSKMDDKTRDRRIEEYKNGEADWIINNGILTTGFDHPALDFIGMLKLTRLSSYWVQMLGRGTRPLYAPGFDLSTVEGRLASIAASPKQNTMVLDFGKNDRLGMINDPVIPMPGERRGPGEAPIRVCDECGSYNHASAPQCLACGFIFPRRDKYDDESSGRKLVKKLPPTTLTQAPAEVADFTVDTVTYDLHHKSADKPPSLKITYHCGFRSFSEWMHFDPASGKGFRSRGLNWWMNRANCGPSAVPKTVAEALTAAPSLRIPKTIKVRLGKYNEVTDYDYETEHENGQPETNRESERLHIS
jgi:DNA repair protein RadD